MSSKISDSINDLCKCLLRDLAVSLKLRKDNLILFLIKIHKWLMWLTNRTPGEYLIGDLIVSIIVMDV